MSDIYIVTNPRAVDNKGNSIIGLLVTPIQPDHKSRRRMVKGLTFVQDTYPSFLVDSKDLSEFNGEDLPNAKSDLAFALARIAELEKENAELKSKNTELELELAASYAESSTTRGELTSAEEQIEELGTKLADAEEKIEHLETFSGEEDLFDPEYPEDFQIESPLPLPVLSTCACYCHSSETKAPCELCFSEKCYMGVPFFEPVIEPVLEPEFWACINISTDYALAEDLQHVPIDAEIIYDTFSFYGICVDVVVSSHPGTFFIKVKYQEEIDRLISRFNNMQLGFDTETIMHISEW